MSELSEETKTRIITELATRREISDIVRDLAADGIETDYKQVYRYHPKGTQFQAAEKWSVLFHMIRAKWDEEAAEQNISSQRWRLKMMEDIAVRQFKKGNDVLALQAMRQAAEERGGALTNERINHNTSPVKDMTREEQRESFIELLRAAQQVKDPAGTTPAPDMTQ